MAWVTINGVMAVSCTLSVPRTGIWRATAMLDTGAGITGAATIVIGDGQSTWQGTVYRSGVAFGATLVRVVGGKHGLANTIPAKTYRNASASVVANDIVRDAGESLSSTASQSILGTNLDHWARIQSQGTSQLQLLADNFGASWRILQDGTVWIGTESWPNVATFSYDLLESHPEQGRDVIASLVPAIQPGMSFNGRNVDYVQIDADHSKITTSIWYQS